MAFNDQLRYFKLNIFFQFAAYVAEKTSTHGSRWFTSLTSHPKTQVSMFILLFATQMVLFGIVIQEVFFEEHTEIKTSMEFIPMDQVEFPLITICSPTFFSKEKIESNNF